jgi:F-type H+-transporting ATPase subunit epsilon
MKVYINTVFEEVYSGEAREVVLPGDEGELSVMNFHQPIVCRLAKGPVRIITRQNKEESINIIDGVAHMEGNVLKIMAEMA